MSISREIETSRLILRINNKCDLEDFSSLMKNEEINRFSDAISLKKDNQDVIILGIILKLGEVFVGCCGLKLIDKDKKYECFYALFPQYWGNGYAVEAMKNLFDYAFNELKATKVLIYLHPKNTRAWKVAERSGMKYMGQFKLEEKDYYQMYFTIEKKDYKTQRYY